MEPQPAFGNWLDNSAEIRLVFLVGGRTAAFRSVKGIPFSDIKPRVVRNLRHLHVPVDDPPRWLTEGKQQGDLLPWRIEWARREAARKAIYDASPKCFVKREWLKMVLKSLHNSLERKPDATVVRFDFAGNIFSIRVDNDAIATGGTGSSWPETVTVLASELRKLPRRILKDEVCILVSPEHLQIENSYFLRVFP